MIDFAAAGPHLHFELWHWADGVATNATDSLAVPVDPTRMLARWEEVHALDYAVLGDTASTGPGSCAYVTTRRSSSTVPTRATPTRFPCTMLAKLRLAFEQGAPVELDVRRSPHWPMDGSVDEGHAIIEGVTLLR